MSVQSYFESEHRRVFVKEGVVSKTKPDFTDPTERYCTIRTKTIFSPRVFFLYLYHFPLLLGI